MTRILAMLLTGLAVSGCSTTASLLRDVGIGPEDNAVMCVRAEIDPSFSESSAVISRLEFPAEFDLSEISPDQLAALIRSC